ncbi:MAG: V-type ATPase 116kDa subunit family protein [Parcubacteria group bacterium]
MAISKTEKIKIIGWKEEEEKILKHLQKTGLIEIEKIEESGERVDAGQSGDYALAEVRFALDFLCKFPGKKKSFKEKIISNKVIISYEKLKNFAEKYDYKPLIFEVKELESGMNAAFSRLEEIRKEEELLRPWIFLKQNPESLETKFTKVVFGTISEKKYINLIQKFNKVKLASVTKVNQISKEIFLEIIYKKEAHNEVSSILEGENFKAVSLPYGGFSPREALNSIALSKKEINAKLNICEEKAKKLNSECDNLKMIYDYLKLGQARTENRSKLAYTRLAFILVGWMEERFIKKFAFDLEKITHRFCLAKMEVGEKEERPVVINNPSYLRPFEAVTNIYGLPKYNELDPTPFLAPFFIIFFALCLTDSGYGLALALLSFLAIKILGVPEENQRLFKLLGLGGIMTFLIGGLFGGWFGLVIEDLPELIARPLLLLRVVDPVKNPLLVLGLTLVLGIIQVWFGILISFFWKAKEEGIKEAVLDKGAWLFFIPVICFFGLSRAGVLGNSTSALPNIMLYSGTGLVVLAGGRKQKNIFLKLGKGIMGLYGLVGYFSDVLSYSRLLALGLATGIIAMVINLIAGLVFNSFSFVGPIIAVFILIGGHLFNLAINVLGAFIHAGRLQFVEFFPKFMEGGGRGLKPFSRKTEFITVVD